MTTAAPTPTRSAHVSSRPFSALPDGSPVEAWTLSNTAGFTLEVLTYGGIVTRVLVPDRHGALADVVLGFDDLASYLAPHPYFGATAGRVAGRISGAAFTLDGQRYELAVNDPPNHLHGGDVGFDKRVWTAEPVNRADGAASVRLRLTSPDGDQGYPGEVEAAVTYTVTADNAFLYETHVIADRPTPVSLTHHSYFNLGGENAGSVLEHELAIFAEDYAPNDENFTLLGRAPVAGTPNDLRDLRRLLDVVDGFQAAHGALFFLPTTTPGTLRPAARLVHRQSGRVLAVSTDEDCIQLYTGVGLSKGPFIGKSGRAYARHGGLCLECEGYPDGVNAPQFGDILVRPGQPRHFTTRYAFSSLAD